MSRQHGSLVVVVGLAAALGFSLALGSVGAEDIAWDLVNSTNQNLVSYSTDAPVFTAPGDGFQKYDVDVDPNAIPYALLDETNGAFPADEVGIIDKTSDFDEFFGICDTVNNDNPDANPYHATWVFDTSSASGDIELWIDLAAMGDFEATATPADVFTWSYQVDAGAPVQVLAATVNEDINQTYTMADGTTRVLDDPLVVAATTMSNQFTTFNVPIGAAGAQLTVVLTAVADGGSEAYAVRNIKVTGAMGLFADGFESGDTGGWDATSP